MTSGGSSPTATLWSRLHDARPVLAPHVRATHRSIRGEPWVIVSSEVSGIQVRVNGPAFEVLARLDGRRTLAEVLHAHAPQADDDWREALAASIVTLESNGLLRLDRAADSARLVARAAAATRAGRRRLDPLALRLPLLDPDRMLGRLLAVPRPVSGRVVLSCGVLLYFAATGVAIAAWPEIGAELVQLAGNPAGWWLYALLYPCLKIVHELAHALTVKHHGGTVHEAGLTLLVLMPVPYVDASDSARFERRGQRLAVSAAGMLAEGAVACAGLLLWSVTEAGLVHQVAFAAAVLGSVSTLLFNANPLLRFDGYYLLQDLLDIPNLGTRASALLNRSWRRHVLRADTGPAPATGPRERRWLASYGIASLGYRWVLTVGIAWWLASTVPFVGIPLALFALYRLAVRPLARASRYLGTSPELAGRRTRTNVGTAAGVGVLGALFVFLPLPASTRVEGVVRASTQATLHAPVAGEIVATAITPGAGVRAGDEVLRLAAPALRGELAVREADIDVLLARRHAVLAADPVAAAGLAVDLVAARAEAATLAREIMELAVAAPHAGRFAPTGGRLTIGRRVARGEVLGHVVGAGGLKVDAVVDQRAIGRVHAGVQAARVRLAERPGTALVARFVTVPPAGDYRWPSVALAGDARRGTAVAAVDRERRTAEPVFPVELALPARTVASGIGGRAYVTLVHEPESLGRRLWRATRQLFLEKLSV